MMPAEFPRDLAANDHRFALVVARFNEVVTKRLLAGAVEALLEHGVGEDDIEIAWVPGSVELPLAAKKLAMSERFDAVICLGCVVKGESTHFDYVASAAQQGTSQVALETGIPCVFGVLTCESMEQAFERAGGSRGNRGYDAGESAIEMANLISAIEKGKIF